MYKTKQVMTLAVLFAVGVLVYFLFSYRSNHTGSFSHTQKEDIQKIIHEYLVNNPDVFREAAQAFQRRSQDELLERTKTAIGTNAQLFAKGNAPVIGNPDGNTVLVEFLDYNCSHCKRMGQIVDGLIKENESLKVVIRQYPIFGEGSLFASKAALAAENQDQFEQFHKALLASTDTLEEATVLAIAEEQGLDLGKLKKDLDSPEVMEKLRESVDIATQLGIRGTPYFIVLDVSAKDESGVEILPGASSQAHLQQLIDQVKSSH